MNLQPLHELVWSYRNDSELAAVWPTPPPDVALAFAFTEAGEAVDAWLRTDPRWARNNHKAHDEQEEWADCLMMLATAAPDGMATHVHPAFADTVEELARMVMRAWSAHAMGRIDTVDTISMAAATIAAYLGGMNHLAQVRARLERIRTKHLGERAHASAPGVRVYDYEGDDA